MRDSDFLNLLTDHYRVVAANLLGTELSVVKRAFVFVGIPMDRTVQPTATALEASQSDLLAASGTAILLLAIFVLSFRSVTVTLGGRTAETTAAGGSRLRRGYDNFFAFQRGDRYRRCGYRNASGHNGS